jgi:hypothetical protein
MILCGLALVSSWAFPSVAAEPLLIPESLCGETQRPAKTVERTNLRIQWERTGGFAGMRIAATMDSESLSLEHARQLRELIEAAGFFELPEEMAGPVGLGGADRFLYTLTVEMEGRRHTVHTSEAAAPPEVRSLILWLTRAARKAKRSGGAP